MYKYSLLAISTLFSLIFLTNCGSDPLVLDPQQKITLLTYTLTPMSGGQSVVFNYENEDGSQSSNGIVNGGTLSMSTMYKGEIEIFAISNDTIANITESIRQDGINNQFFYTSLNPAILVTYDDNDVDADGKPIGILTNLTTVNNTAEGNLTLTLKHDPDKDGLSVSTGNVTASMGRTDIEINFPVIVQ